MIYRLYYSFSALQSLWAVAALLAIPADPKNAVLLGLSAQRLVLLSAALALSIVFGLLAVRSWRDETWYPEHVSRIRRILLEHRVWGWLVFVSLFLFFSGAVLIGISGSQSFFVLAPPGEIETLELQQYFVDLTYFRLAPYLARLLPLIRLAAGLALQSLIMIPVMALGWRGWIDKLKNHRIFSVLALLAALLLVGSLLGGARLRIQPDIIGWNTIGGPLLDTQALGLLLLGILLLLLARPAAALEKARLFGRAVSWDALLFVLFWVLAAVHWLGIPLEPSWYLSPARPPNMALYPNSDAAIYDLTAQNMLVGEGLKTGPFNTDIIRRPLLTFFIGLLHTLAGQDFVSVGALQSALLALLPALVYLIGMRFHSRVGGILAACLVVLREGNTIALADQITVSHSKLLMPDLPSAVLAAGFLLAAHAWLSAARKPFWALLAGGILGAAALIRIEFLVFLPVAGAAAAWRFRSNWRRWAQGVGLMLVGGVLFISPWLIRNWQRTGKLYIEVPDWRIPFFIDRLFNTEASLNGQSAGPLLPPAAEPVTQAVQPSTAEVVVDHFLHSNLQAVLTFPDIFRLVDAFAGYIEHHNPDRFWEACCGRENYIQRLPFWQWYKWDMSLPVQTLVPVVVTLFLLSLGMVQFWRSHGMVGLLPFLMYEAYVLVNAMVRTSGGRYLLPVDWAWLVYYGIGLGVLAGWLLRLVKSAGKHAAAPTRKNDPLQAPRPARMLWLVAGGIIAAGAAIPLGERLYPPQYLPETGGRWLEQAIEQQPAVQDLLESGGTAWYGRALYPRAYAGGMGEQGTTFPNLYPQPFPRLAFLLVGPETAGVVIAAEAGPGLSFPQAADVLVAGCRTPHPKGAYIQAVFVYLPDADTLIQSESANLAGLSCPPP